MFRCKHRIRMRIYRWSDMLLCELFLIFLISDYLKFLINPDFGPNWLHYIYLSSNVAMLPLEVNACDFALDNKSLCFLSSVIILILQSEISILTKISVE